MATMVQSISRSAIGLGLFAVITGGTIALTQAVTKERIAEQAARAEAAALFEIIPESTHSNDMLNDTISLPDAAVLNSGETPSAWVARQQSDLVGFIIPVTATDGYSGDINLLVGMTLSGELLGVRVTGHRETPGLGDRIETRKSDWVYQFNGRSLANTPGKQWNVKKNGGEFDQFTGATITPRAVVKAVHKTLVYVRKHQAEIRQSLGLPVERGNRKQRNAVASHLSEPEH
jgi:electron transport complex protein RnfG